MLIYQRVGSQAISLCQGAQRLSGDVRDAGNSEPSGCGQRQVRQVTVGCEDIFHGDFTMKKASDYVKHSYGKWMNMDHL